MSSCPVKKYYHGTSFERAISIKLYGLKPDVYVSEDKDIAELFAQVRMLLDKDKLGAVLEVTLPSCKLEVDETPYLNQFTGMLLGKPPKSYVYHEEVKPQNIRLKKFVKEQDIMSDLKQFIKRIRKK